MRSSYDRMYDEARKQSDLEFTAGQREAAAKTCDYMHIYHKFYESVTTIMLNIPENRRTTADNLRIMRGHQHAIECLAKECDSMINTHTIDAVLGKKKDREEEREIFEILNILDDLTTQAGNYLEHGQKGWCKVDLDFYLSANKALLAYYKRLAEWLSNSDIPVDIKYVINQGRFTPVKFVENVSVNLIRNIITPKLSALDSRQLSDLAYCYHAIAKIYMHTRSVQECLAYSIMALETNNAIPSAFKTEDDVSRFTTILTTLDHVTYEKYPKLHAIGNLGYGFFDGGVKCATTSILNNIYKQCVGSGSLAEQQLLLVIMCSIYDNYQIVKYPTNLLSSLQDPAYHTEFSRMLETLKSRVAENVVDVPRFVR